MHFKINYSSLCETLIDFFKALTFKQTFHNELDKVEFGLHFKFFCGCFEKAPITTKKCLEIKVLLNIDFETFS